MSIFVEKVALRIFSVQIQFDRYQQLVKRAQEYEEVFSPSFNHPEKTAVSPNSYSLDSIVDYLVRENATIHARFPDVSRIFCASLRKLLDGFVLDVVNLMDFLTFSLHLDGNGYQTDDFAIALSIMARMEPSEQADSLLECVWNRLLISTE